MTSSSSAKIFILDTNVILHDSACINNFQEHDIVIPITVLEELDQFKKGNQTLNYHAREFVRALDALSAGKLLNGGVQIGPDKGNAAAGDFIFFLRAFAGRAGKLFRCAAHEPAHLRANG